MPSIPRDRHWQFRFLVITPTRVVDLTSYLISARITLGDVSTVGTGATGTDGLSAVADFTLANDRPNTDALQPSAPHSSWNKALDGVTPELLLHPYRQVRLESRWRVPGGAWPEWALLFDGLLGDSIRTDARAHTIKVRARDHAKRMMDTFIDTLSTFGAPEGTPAPEVIQSIWDSTLNLSPVLHAEPEADEFLVAAYSPLHVTVWDTSQEIAAQMGWYLGYRKHPLTGEFVPTLLDPPRGKTVPDFVFDADDVKLADVDQSDRDVRNAVRVYYVDDATRERVAYPMDGPLIDPESVASLGGVQKLMVFEEGSTSQITSAVQAQALASRALHDLSGLMASTQVTLPFVPELQLFDLVGIDVPTQGVNEAYGVQSLQHNLDFSRGFKAETVFSGAGKVTGARKQWLDRELRPGSPADENPHAVKLLPPFTTIESSAAGGFAVVTDTGRSRGVRAIGVEVHVSSISGFTPSAHTLWARGPEGRFLFTDVPANSFWFVRCRSYDGEGRFSEFTPEIDAGLAGLPNAVAVNSGTLTSARGPYNFSVTSHTTYITQLQTAGGPARYRQFASGVTVPEGRAVTGQWNTVISWTGDPIPPHATARIVPPRGYFRGRDNSPPPPPLDQPNLSGPLREGTYPHAGLYLTDGGRFSITGLQSSDGALWINPSMTVQWRLVEYDAGWDEA